MRKQIRGSIVEGREIYFVEKKELCKVFAINIWVGLGKPIINIQIEFPDRSCVGYTPEELTELIDSGAITFPYIVG